MDSQAFQISATDAAILLRGQAAPDRRQAVHVMFVLDISDSMSDGHKLGNVKKSIEFLVPLLQPEDAVSIVTFGENSAVVLQPTPATERDLILGKVSALRTDGCTNLSAGLMSVRDVIQGPTTSAGRKQGIFLLTDGHANRGVSDPDGLKRIVQSLLTDHPELTLTTFGYGVDHNVPLLTDMATAGGGSYNVVYNLENVATTFGEAIGGLTTVVAQNVTLLLPEDAEPLTGYKVIKTAGQPTQIRIGDVYAENQVVVLFGLGTDAALPIGLTFHDMLGLRSVAESLAIGPVPADGVPKIVEQAQFRYKVSEILKEATRNLLAAGLKGRAEALLAQLKELPYFQEQLIQMMIDDLEDLLEGIDRAEAPYDGNIPAAVALGATPSAPAARQTSQWGQHSAYLALGRGMRSLAPEPDDEPYNYAPGAGAPLGRVSSLAPAYSGGGAGGPPRRQNAVHFGATAVAQDPDATGTPPASPPLGPALAPAPTSRVRTAVVDAESSPFMNLPQMRMATLMRASSSAAAPPPSAHQRSRSPTPPPAGGRLMRSSGAAPTPAAAAPSSPLARSATSAPPAWPTQTPPPGLAPSATSPSGGGE
jgi:uncharacterized protein YegL